MSKTNKNLGRIGFRNNQDDKLDDSYWYNRYKEYQHHEYEQKLREHIEGLSEEEYVERIRYTKG